MMKSTHGLSTGECFCDFQYCLGTRFYDSRFIYSDNFPEVAFVHVFRTLILTQEEHCGYTGDADNSKEFCSNTQRIYNRNSRCCSTTDHHKSGIRKEECL